MTTTLAVCIIACVLILSTFSFLTIVYLSELKREREIRAALLKENDELNTKIPVILMDLSKPVPSNLETKPKKNIN